MSDSGPEPRPSGPRPAPEPGSNGMSPGTGFGSAPGSGGADRGHAPGTVSSGPGSGIDPGYRPATDGGPGVSGVPGPLQGMARNAWQAVLLIGVCAVIFGLMALVWPSATLAVLGILFGIYLLVSGVMQLVAAFGTHTETSLRVLAFISGALSILLGVFCFRGALESVLLLAIWIGIAWLFRGISLLAAAASDPAMPARGWQLFAGAVGVIASIVVLSSPLNSIWVLTLFGGIWLIVTGVVEIITALRLRSHAKQIPQGV